MCRAAFSAELGAPMLAGSVVFPHRETGREVAFLIDTGADITCINEITAIDLGIDPDEMGEDIDYTTETTEGVGGESEIYKIQEPVLLAFEEEVEDEELWNLHVESMDGITISQNSPVNLLGRDILHRFVTEYNPVEGEILMRRSDDVDAAYQCIETEQPMLPEFHNFSSNQSRSETR